MPSHSRMTGASWYLSSSWTLPGYRLVALVEQGHHRRDAERADHLSCRHQRGRHHRRVLGPVEDGRDGLPELADLGDDLAEITTGPQP